MLLFYINSILMFYPKICFRKQVTQKDVVAENDEDNGYWM